MLNKEVETLRYEFVSVFIFPRTFDERHLPWIRVEFGPESCIVTINHGFPSG